MRMVEKEELQSDSRFYINQTTLDDIFKRNNNRISRYDLIDVNIGKLRRSLYGRISPLYKTEPFMFLNNPDDPEAIDVYEAYCDIPGARKDNPNRSVSYFRQFMRDFTGDYDIGKGAIIIDQYYRIQEGLHRSCILYKKYGPDYKVRVIRFHILYSFKTRLRCFMQMWIFDFRLFLHLV